MPSSDQRLDRILSPVSQAQRPNDDLGGGQQVVVASARLFFGSSGHSKALTSRPILNIPPKNYLVVAVEPQPGQGGDRPLFGLSRPSNSIGRPQVGQGKLCSAVSLAS